MVTDTGLSVTNYRWQKTPVDRVAVTALSKKLGLSPLLAHLLVARGFSEAEEVDKFLKASLASIPEPRLMLNMEKVADLLRKALHEGRSIRIVGDYDCDGTTGLITLKQAFQIVNPQARVSYYVPDREKEGYGLNPKIVEQAKRDGVEYLISVDIGITAHKEWEMACQLGITGICIDHHTVLGSMAPQSAVVLCPKQAGCNYPEKELAACGISLQLARMLLAEHPRRDEIIRSLCKLVAIGTVSDMVTLRSCANRAIVKAGLAGLNSGSPNKGLSALIEVSGLRDRKITAYDLGFKLGPRINAAGRMGGSTLQVIELLNADSMEQARQLASQIDWLNMRRQQAQQRLVDELLVMVEMRGRRDLVLVHGGKHDSGWHQGIVGIAAAKLVERYGRPALVCSIRNGLAYGSARSIKSFDILRALEAVSDGLLLRFGGHSAAAGFMLDAARIDELRTRINEYARVAFEGTDLTLVRNYDLELTPADITVGLIKEISCLEPHGIDNPRPTFVVRGRLVEARQVGGKHLKMKLVGRGPALDAIWWHHGELVEKVRPNAVVALMGKLEINEWNGYLRPQLNVDDLQLLKRL
ncbi:MAG: single-stranded-DNA-specific exonuclease RecJ [Acidobacteriota bacterium]|nr:single-stranded-DNA-specific exonuclease RecJ [Blastocatellia bacterium]MDW8413385.1 single-stranded-DNA-specific exonuclease RecJ [Acidobacteriota bacterium]